MEISVIGYKGFIGSAVVRGIERLGHKTICVGRSDELSLHSQIVIDCNGNSSKFQVNNNPEQGFVDIVEAVSDRVMQSNVNARFIYISSGEVYGNEQNDSKEVDLIEVQGLSHYGRLKFEAEELIRNQFNNHLIVRPSGFVGAGLKKNPIFDMLHGSQVFVHEESLFQFCDVDWFADTIAHMALKSFVGTLNVSTTGSISIKEVAETMKVRQPKVATDAKFELHKLNTDLLSTFIEVPSTFSHVERYILSVKNPNGQENI
jgi:nucleoside-diphosphate-sugar epimerase